MHGQLVIPGFIEGHGHFTGVGEAQLNLNLMNVALVGRDRGDGRRGREDGQAGPVDPRARLAPGEVDGAADAERRRLSDARVARSRVAGQSGRPHARQRPRELRQRQGDGAVGHDTDDAEPGGRRNPEGRERRADRPAARDGVRLDQRDTGIERGRAQLARDRKVLELASRSRSRRGSRASRTPARRSRRST